MAEQVRVAVLVSGRGSNLLALAEYRRRDPARSYEIALVASNVLEARGLVLAKRFGIKTWSLSHVGMTREAFDATIDQALRAHDVELVVLAGYMRLLSPWFVERWQGRILNIHPSLLPLHKGLDTHNRAILAGDDYAGCSVHIVTAKLDDGPVLAQAQVKILARDDADSLAARVLVAEHQLYPEVLDRFADALRTGDEEGADER